MISSCCDSILHKIENLVTYFKCFHGDVTIRISNCDIRNLIRNIARIRFEDTKGYKKDVVRFDLKFDNNIPQFVPLDQEIVIDILNNIFSNAQKYCEKGSISCTVRLRREKETFRAISRVTIFNITYLEIRVKDTGIGISEEKLELLFKPYETIDDQENLSVKQPSFSIGLVNVKVNVEKMGGRIEVKSEGRGRGAEVIISIPVDKESESEESEGESEEGEEEEGEEEESEGESEESDEEDYVPISPKNESEEGEEGKEKKKEEEETIFHNFLIVDDCSINLRVLRFGLETCSGSESLIYEARDGEKAMKLLEQVVKESIIEKLPLPIVITDLNMPNLDGYDFLREVRKKYGSDIIIIAITATVIPEKIEFLALHDFDGIFEKPVPFSLTKKIYKSSTKRNTMKYLEIREKQKNYSNYNDEFLEIVKETNENLEKVPEKTGFSVKMVEEIRSRKVFFTVYQSILQFFAHFITFCLIYDPIEPSRQQIGCSILSKYTLIGSLLTFLPFWYFHLSVDFLATLCIVREIGITFFGSRVLYDDLFFLYVCRTAEVFELMSVFSNFNLMVVCELLSAFSLVYCEFMRPQDSILKRGEDNYTYQILICDIATIVYFIFDMIGMSTKYVWDKKNRFKRWEKLMNDMKNVDKTHRLTISQISHDLCPLTSTLSQYTKRILKRKISDDPLSKEEEEEEKWLLHGVISLDISMQNFIRFCKLRQDKIRSNCDQPSSIVYITRNLKELIYSFKGEDERESMKITFSFFVNGKEVDISFLELKNDIFSFLIDERNVLLILQNLVSNALFHSQFLNLNIVCSINTENKMLEFVVSDDGIGMDTKTELEECSLYFKKNNRKFTNNLGLGLKVSVRLAELIKNGCLEILSKNKKGEGTTCIFKCSYFSCMDSYSSSIDKNQFILENVEPNNHIVNDFNISRKKKKKEKRRKKKKKKKNIKDVNILIVDDCKINLLYEKMISKKFGFVNVFSTLFPEEGQDMLTSKYFDVLLIDYKLSSTTTGKDIVKKLVEKYPSRKPEHIVLVTGDMCLRKDSEVLEGLFDHVIIKPVKLEDIRAVFENIFLF